MATRAILFTGGILIAGCAWPASAQSPAAIVEDVDSRGAGVEVMDYLEPGRVVTLGPNDKLVLSYLRSCVQETIANGTVTIGSEQSEVAAGKLERAKVACDATQASLTPEQLKKSGAMAFRAGPKKGKSTTPQVTIYGTSPVVEAKGAGKLTVERLDQPGEKIEVTIEAGQLVKGTFYDLSKSNHALAAGGTYRAILGSNEVVFKVDASAKPGAGPVVGRLVRFVPAS